MAKPDRRDGRKTAIHDKHSKPQTIIKCSQINLQHSKAATANLMELIEKEEIDVAFIQETHTIHDRVAGITKGTEHLLRPQERSGQPQ